jgi:hypothetical protein
MRSDNEQMRPGVREEVEWKPLLQWPASTRAHAANLRCGVAWQKLVEPFPPCATLQSCPTPASALATPTIRRPALLQLQILMLHQRYSDSDGVNDNNDDFVMRVIRPQRSIASSIPSYFRPYCRLWSLRVDAGRHRPRCLLPAVASSQLER